MNEKGMCGEQNEMSCDGLLEKCLRANDGQACLRRCCSVCVGDSSTGGSFLGTTSKQ